MGSKSLYLSVVFPGKRWCLSCVVSLGSGDFIDENTWRTVGADWMGDEVVRGRSG